MVGLGVLLAFRGLGVYAAQNLVQIVDYDVFQDRHFVLNFEELSHLLIVGGLGQLVGELFLVDEVGKGGFDVLDESGDGVVAVEGVKFGGRVGSGVLEGSSGRSF